MLKPPIISLWKCLSCFLGDQIIGMRAEDSSHQFAPMWDTLLTGIIPLNASELAKERVAAIQKIFHTQWWIDALNISWGIRRDVNRILQIYGMDFLRKLPRIWRYRLTTSTCQFHWEWRMHYCETKYVNMHKFCDYADVSDWWARVLDPDELIREGDQDLSLSLEQYLSSKGGGMIPQDLYNHPIFWCILPDDLLRRQYISCLRILDVFSISNKNEHSLWRPGEMKEGYMRLIGLWIKWEAVYPPNTTTKWHTFVCARWPNFVKTISWLFS